jgi:DNA polymerase
MARGYGVRLPADQVERSVRGWRHANPWAPVFWSDLERAYWSAMRHPGAEFDAGRVTYLYDGQTLWYALPSGRVLCYPYARIEGDEISYAKASWKPAADAKGWPRARLWRGLACENVTQAAAHDVLREALRRLDGVVAHVHDEIVLEVPEGEAEEAKAMLEQVMTTAPDWAAGLPLAVEAKIMRRYGK